TGDGMGDVFVVSANSTVLGLKGKTSYPSGELLWKLNLPEAKRIISTPAVYDFDKSGIPQFVLGTEDGRIIVIKSNPKRKEFEIAADIRASNVPITSSPVIGDLFGTGMLQILFANSMDSLQIVSTNAKTLKNLDVWPMFLGGPGHIGFEGLGGYKSSFVKRLLVGFVILAVFLFFRIRFSVARNAKKVRVQFL
ncbi:MAG: hypothetical protein FWC57_04865, partial [Endomicrobia bacterium]|nr:hypothetical protein [Endomicrobiia bacterium]